MKAGWVRQRERTKVVELLKVKKLDEGACADEYRKVLDERWRNIEGGKIDGVEKEWLNFKNAVNEVTCVWGEKGGWER